MASGTIPIPAKYYYEDFSTTSGTGAWKGWYRGTSDKYIGNRLSKLRAMFITRASENAPCMVFLSNDQQYAYLVNVEPNRQMSARFVFER